MKVLFLGPLPEPVTGHSLACQVLYDELVTTHHVELVNLNKSEFAQGVSSANRIFEVLGMIWRIWRRRNFGDVIYFTTSESMAGNIKDLLIYTVCFRALKRMVIHLHGGAGMRVIMARAGLLRALNEFFLRRLGAVIVLGQRHVDIFSPPVPRVRIHTVPNFAQDHLFVDADVVERKFDLVRPLRILFLSNLLPGKGHEELVRAVGSMSRAEREALQVDFAGGFETEAQKQQFLADIAAIPQIRYHGTVHGEQKSQLLARAHVFCLPTYYAYEGQPISILEAYASGCAVITTDHSGIFDVFADAVNGSAVDKRSPESLRAALVRALHNPDELSVYALRNRALALERYRTRRYASDVRGVLEKVHRHAAR